MYLVGIWGEVEVYLNPGILAVIVLHINDLGSSCPTMRSVRPCTGRASSSSSLSSSSST